MKQEMLKQIPSITDLLASEQAAAWLTVHPRQLVTDCLRDAVEDLRRQILADAGGRCGAATLPEFVLQLAGGLLAERTEFHLRGAINATGVILHTGLGRSVLPECVVESMTADLRGYLTLAVDRASGERSDRDRRVEYILQELTGAEAATVVNNNAAATMLVLAALAAGRETIISRGELIEIGGAFRLPDVMAASGTTMVEIGTTNRTHLRDYERAITERTGELPRASQQLSRGRFHIAAGTEATGRTGPRAGPGAGGRPRRGAGGAGDIRFAPRADGRRIHRRRRGTWCFSPPTSLSAPARAGSSSAAGT